LSEHPARSAGEITYGSYLALEELLTLQRPRTSPEHPDELLFIVVHQASELWFKVLLHELEALVTQLQRGDVLASVFALKRINALMSIVTAQLSALDTLPPHRFAEFRGYLGSSSGSQSAQFRALEAASGLREPHFLAALEEHGEPPALVKEWLARPTLQQLFDDLLDRHRVTLEAVYQDPGQSPLLLLAESLLEYEQSFALWRYLHVQLVERIIGPLTGGTGGTLGAKYLQRTVTQRFSRSCGKCGPDSSDRTRRHRRGEGAGHLDSDGVAHTGMAGGQAVLVRVDDDARWRRKCKSLRDHDESSRRDARRRTAPRARRMARLTRAAAWRLRRPRRRVLGGSIDRHRRAR
jgi:tryptophan 2,3-dioxygenase